MDIDALITKAAYRACRTFGPCRCSEAGKTEPCGPARRTGADIVADILAGVADQVGESAVATRRKANAARREAQS